MQEQIRFKLSNDFLQQHIINEASVNKELQFNLKLIESLLQSYHYKARGRVFDVAIQNDSVELLNQDMAKVLVIYSVGQFNACADLDFNERTSMEMLVDIDKDVSEATLTGEFIPEREPDEI
ncbi:MAG TPA: hypothetical protein VGB63_03795 [Pedobacter sp.]|jgi:hypothetical protein